MPSWRGWPRALSDFSGCVLALLPTEPLCSPLSSPDFRLRRAFVTFPHGPGGARIDSGLTDMRLQRLGVGHPLAVGRDRRPRLPAPGIDPCPGICTCACPGVCGCPCAAAAPIPPASSTAASAIVVFNIFCLARGITRAEKGSPVNGRAAAGCARASLAARRERDQAGRNRFPLPTSPCVGRWTRFSGSATACPMTQARRPCRARIASAASTSLSRQDDAEPDPHIVDLEHLGATDAAAPFDQVEYRRRRRQVVENKSDLGIDPRQIQQTLAGDVDQRRDIRHALDQLQNFAEHR